VIWLVLPLVATGPALAALISVQQEISIGRQVARELEGKYGLYRDPTLDGRVAAVGERLAAVSDRPDLPYTFKILNTSEVNAVAAPGGFIYLTRGMVFFLRSDDELAFVLGHEVAHAARRHGAQMIERNFAWSLGLWILIRVLGGDPTAVQIADFARFLITRGYSREFEFEADRYGILYMRRAGFDPAASLVVLERLRAEQRREPSQFEVLFRTHPALSERIERVRGQLREMGYMGILHWQIGAVPV